MGHLLICVATALQGRCLIISQSLNFFNMKLLIVLFALGVAVSAEVNKPSPVGECFVEFVNCAAAGEDFMAKAKCLKDFRDCVSEACRIPECWDAHATCRKAAVGFVDYFWCNVHYMKCMHKHRHDRCKPKSA